MHTPRPPTLLTLLLSTAFVLGAGQAQATSSRDSEPPQSRDPGFDGQYHPTGKGWGELSPGAHLTGEAKGGKGGGGGGSGGGSTSNGINYHGGPLMLGTTKVYYIWYGDWSYDSVATTLLPQLAGSIGGSAYYNINTTYYDGSNAHVSNSVLLAGQAFDTAYSRGKALGDSDIAGIVGDAINSGQLPRDTNGVYFVLTSKDVNETSGFCTQYCGWHSYGTLTGSRIKFSFVGDPARCPSACSAQATGPNGSGGADGMASVIAHELEEAVTDPELNAWYDRRGYENADKCAWTYGTTWTSANGAKANVNLGGSDFLIQRNWVNANGGLCTMAW